MAVAPKSWRYITDVQAVHLEAQRDGAGINIRGGLDCGVQYYRH
jgi:hypothetical protein